MKILKSANIFIFIWKYVKYFKLKQLLPFEIYGCEICEKFAYKHSEIIDYAHNQTCCM